MKINQALLFVTATLLFFVGASCLGSGDSYEYSSDDTIHAFGIDTVYGITYTFSIDQINNRIYNKDSIPFRADTVIDKILITTLEVASGGYVLSGDTLFSTSDSIDLSHTMTEPLKLKVYSPDGLNTRTYNIEVRMHRQDPDTLIWKKQSNAFLVLPSPTAESEEEDTEESEEGNKEEIDINYYKVTAFKGSLWAYLPGNRVYEAPTSGGAFAGSPVLHTLTGLEDELLPATVTTANFSDLKRFALYASTAQGNVYTSTDGVAWQKMPALSGNVETLLACTPGTLTGIQTTDGIRRFCGVNTTDFAKGWTPGDEVPETFPKEPVSSTFYRMGTGLYKTFLTGTESLPGLVRTTPWYTFDGLQWQALKAPNASSDTVSYHCPYVEQPSMIRYNDLFYFFGSGFESFYQSIDGLVWSQTQKKVFFPEEFQGRTRYQAVLDDDNYLWIIWDRNEACGDEVWSGRINRMGFLIQ